MRSPVKRWRLTRDTAPAGGAVPVTWLQRPTLTERGAHLPLAGVSKFQKTIEAAAGGRTAGGPNVRLVTVRLDIVQEGPYAGSVRASIGGQEIGSLPSGEAAAFHETLALLAARDTPATCRALIYGGHYDNTDREWRLLGVGIIAATTPVSPASDAAPFLPPVVGSDVVCSREVAARLDDSLNSKAKNKRVARGALLQASASGWFVVSSGELVGKLHPNTQEPRQRALREAEAAGFPLTARMRVIREQGSPLRVVVDLP